MRLDACGQEVQHQIYLPHARARPDAARNCHRCGRRGRRCGAVRAACGRAPLGPLQAHDPAHGQVLFTFARLTRCPARRRRSGSGGVSRSTAPWYRPACHLGHTRRLPQELWRRSRRVASRTPCWTGLGLFLFLLRSRSPSQRQGPAVVRGSRDGCLTRLVGACSINLHLKRLQCSLGSRVGSRQPRSGDVQACLHGSLSLPNALYALYHFSPPRRAQVAIQVAGRKWLHFNFGLSEL